MIIKAFESAFMSITMKSIEHGIFQGPLKLSVTISEKEEGSLWIPD